tara:strand:- start:677 stop:1777 length:1101 start_codon:yes stop_codon:yes gene_type:complete
MDTRNFILAICMSALSTNVMAQSSFPTFEWGGRIQADATAFDNDKFSYNAGTEIRRGRLFVGGDLSSRWEWRIQYDFAPDDPELKDGYIRYNASENSRITIGNFKQFSSLEEITSSNHITFTERSLLNALVTSRRTGIGYQRWGENYNFAASTYTHGANNKVRGDGVASRFVYRPEIGGADTLFHLGINVARETPGGDRLRLRARPESHQDDHRIVNTGNIEGVDSYNKLGFESAFVNGRFSAQAEYVRQNLDRELGPDLSFDGYYAYVSYFLTNDTRPYSSSNAAFDRVRPSNSGGAWELAARVSHLDLNNVDIQGGSIDTFSIGANYYMTNDLRFVLNYVMADSDDFAGDDDPNTWVFRIRWTF